MSTSKANVKLSAEMPECGTDGCDRKRSFMDQHCRYHEILTNAPLLTAGELDSLRAELANLEVLTAAERDALRQASALRWVSTQSRSLEQSRQSAIDAGVTAEQIAQAIADGAARYRKADQ